MAAKTTKRLSNRLPKSGLFSHQARHQQDDQSIGEEVDLGRLSALIKQKLSLAQLNQALNMMDDFIAQKQAETLAEIQIVEAFKTLLLEKRAAFSKKAKKQ